MKKTLLVIFACLSLTFVSAQTQVLADTSLELIGAGTGTDWASTSTNFPSVMCDAASCGTCGGPCVPATGTWYAWFGGAGGPLEEGTLDQAFTVATAGAGLLRFQYALAIPSGVTADTMTLDFDGTQVWGTSGIDSTIYGTTYQTVLVPMAAVTAGAHTISFYGRETGTGTSAFNALVDDITFIVGGAIGYTEYDFTENVTISTNNPNHELNLAFNLPQARDMQISVMDMTGRVVAAQNMTGVTTNYVTFNTMDYAAGVYSVVITDGFTSSVHKVVVQ